MKIVFSLKRSSYKETETAEALKKALTTGIGVTTKVFDADPNGVKLLDAHIRGMVRNGYVCHTADYADTFMSDSTLISAKVA